MKTKILTMLRGTDDYISGQEICDRLGVSRTAVWKVINQLKEEGYVIEAVNNKGYRITEYPDILTQSELESAINIESANGEGTLAKKLVCRDIVDSTNNVARKLAEDMACHGTLVVAEQQTGGKGRRGRHWESPAGTGIWMTYVLRPDISPDRASMLTLVAALAVADGIKEQLHAAGCDCEFGIKWPNDIVLNGHKIVGILTEMSATPDSVNYVVVGIGINVNTTEFDDSIKATASSILVQTGLHIQRSRIIASVSRRFEEYYNIFIKTANLEGLIEQYNSVLINAGREVRLISSDNGTEHEETGVAEGIDMNGELIVRLDDGTMKNVIAGEVSVRGLYGYV